MLKGFVYLLLAAFMMAPQVRMKQYPSSVLKLCQSAPA